MRMLMILSFIKHKKSLRTTIIVHTFDYATNCRVMIGVLIHTPPPPPTSPTTQVMRSSSCTQDKINFKIYEEPRINGTDVLAISAKYYIKRQIWNYFHIPSTPSTPPPPIKPHYIHTSTFCYFIGWVVLFGLGTISRQSKVYVFKHWQDQAKCMTDTPSF